MKVKSVKSGLVPAKAPPMYLPKTYSAWTPSMAPMLAILLFIFLPTQILYLSVGAYCTDKVKILGEQIEKEEDYLKQQYEQIVASEIEISSKLKTKYGDINIDIKTGDITYPKI